MKRIIRRVIAILLCVTALILVFVPSPESYASTVRGDYEMDGSVIVKYLGNADRVTIPNMVTEIGKDAFADCASIVKVTIPDSVTTIGYQAFENCINLEEVVIPESVRVIDSSAFSGCVRLKKVNLPEKTKSLGSGVFAGCNSLSTVPIAGGNLYYVCRDGVIYNYDGTEVVQYLAGRPYTGYSMPGSIEKIREYAFWGASNLTDLIISSKVKTIPEYAFANCSGLTNVVLPYGVQSLMAYSFADCDSLRNISIPDSVGYIDVNAFASCKSAALQFDGEVGTLTGTPAPSQTGTGTSTSTVSGNALQTDDSGDTVYTGDLPVSTRGNTTTAGPYDTIEDFGDTRIIGGQALVMMSRRPPVRGFDLEAAEEEDDVAESNYDNIRVTNFGDYYLVNGIYSEYSGGAENVAVPSGAERIGNRAFYQNENLKAVSIPDTVTSIGDFAFAKTGLTSVKIPETVTSIGYAAFYQCEKLADVDIPESVQTIELGAFDGSGWLNLWKYDPSGSSYLIVGDGILLAYKGGGGKISIPDGVKTIGPQCFYDNDLITGVIFPDSVLTIGEEAFDGCTNLKEVSLPNNLQRIEDRAFMNTGLTQAIIPISVRSIGVGAFDNSELHPMDSVVFLGNDLPSVSYKPTAMRISGERLRTPSFNGVPSAIVSANADPRENGSVVSPESLGFRGQVYTITDSSSYPGELELKSALSEPDEEGQVVIDPHVYAGNRSYIMTNVSDLAFNNYDESNYYNGRLIWAGRALQDISIDGNESDALKNLLGGVYTTEEEPELSDNNAIAVTCDPSVFPTGNGASAVLPGSRENYILSVSSDDSTEDVFKDFIAQETGTTRMTLVPLDLSLRTMRGNINISKLGTGKLEVCIPVPQALSGKSGLYGAMLNDNYLYEPVALSEIVVDGVDCIRFVASHLSPFAVYSLERESEGASVVQSVTGSTTPETGEIMGYSTGAGTISVSSSDNANYLSDNRMEVVVNTLNKKVGDTVEIKWFLIVILLCLGMILFLVKDKKQNKNGQG